MARVDILSIFFITIFCAIAASDLIKNENNILFEKCEYEVHDRSVITQENITFRLIARNTVKFNITLVLDHPLQQLWMNFVLYHKYLRYQRFLVNTWDDLCVLRGPMIDLVMQNLNRIGTEFHFKLQCPYSGTIMLTNNGFNMSEVVVPLVPSGKYRLDYNLALGRKKSPVITISVFTSVSDLRVWF